MKLFKIIDGAYLGFYQERGGTVFISGYRTVTKTVCDWKTVIKEITTPDDWRYVRYYVPGHMGQVTKTEPEHTETRTRIVPEHTERRTETIPAHWGTREYWLEPHIEIQYREVPGHYEIQSIWVPEYYVTRYYWREAHPARGIEAGWIPYQHLIPAGYKDQRVWVATYQESYEVEIPGCWQERRIWFPDVTRSYTILVSEREEEYEVVIPVRHYSVVEWIPVQERFRWVNYGGKKAVGEDVVWACEDVEVEEPIYSYYGHEDEYDLIDRQRGPVVVIVGPPVGDMLQLRIIETGDIIDVEAEYLGVTVRNDDDAYVLP